MTTQTVEDNSKSDSRRIVAWNLLKSWNSEYATTRSLEPIYANVHIWKLAQD